MSAESQAEALTDLLLNAVFGEDRIHAYDRIDARPMWMAVAERVLAAGYLSPADHARAVAEAVGAIESVLRSQVVDMIRNPTPWTKDFRSGYEHALAHVQETWDSLARQEPTSAEGAGS